MLPNEKDGIMISDIVLNVICNVGAIVILNIFYQYYVQFIFDFAMKIGG